MTTPAEETTHRGVRWRRQSARSIQFFDSGADRWIDWAPGVDAPPMPPGWGQTRVARAGWRTRWRLIPLILVIAAVGIAVTQVFSRSSNDTAKEKAAAEAMRGQCLAQHGTFQGHPKYSSTPVPCTSPQAAVKVIQVVPSTPGSPTCPAGTTTVEIAIYSDVRYPHLECVEPLRH